jgi:diadenosine tetraphosphatase ApaH/serine/threonine PP2A family protein phosphatase
MNKGCTTWVPAGGQCCSTRIRNAHSLGRHRQWLAIVGSAGQPRDRNNKACYALADLDRSRLTFFRVPYDHGLAAQKIRSAGLPERVARRLERGS